MISLNLCRLEYLVLVLGASLQLDLLWLTQMQPGG